MMNRKIERIYQGRRIDLLAIDVKNRQGQVVRREIVDHPGAVVILPLLGPEKVLLIRNERFVVQDTLWELPAGTLEKGEKPLACAERELVEETGYEAGKIEPLLSFYSTPGFCNEILYVFMAQDLNYVGQKLDDTENIVVEPLSFPLALKMIKEGTIRDAKTIASLLYFHTYSHP